MTNLSVSITNDTGAPLELAAASADGCGRSSSPASATRPGCSTRIPNTARVSAPAFGFYTKPGSIAAPWNPLNGVTDGGHPFHVVHVRGNGPAPGGAQAYGKRSPGP